MASSSLPISPSALPPLPSTKLKLKTRHFLEPPIFPRSICPISVSSSNSHPLGVRNHQKRRRLWRVFTGSEEVLAPDPTQLNSSEQIVSSTGDEGVAYVIQVLLLVAFLALAILTAGVLYIGVQEFLQKREREKFEKEEGAKQKGKKKRKVVRARAGPRGFGQKIEPDDDLD